MFTVFFRNSTTTPSQPGLRQLVGAALSDVEAEWTGMEAELRLKDGALLYLFGEDEEEGMLAEYPALTPAVADALYQIASRTNALLIDNLADPVALRTHDNVGEVRPADMSVFGPDTLAGPEQLYTILEDLRPNPSGQETVIQPPAPSRRTSRQQSVFNRLSDLLFGKSI